MDVRLAAAPAYVGEAALEAVRAALSACADAGMIAVTANGWEKRLEVLSYATTRMVHGVRCPVTVVSFFRVQQFREQADRVMGLLTAAGWSLEHAAAEVSDPEMFFMYGPGLTEWVDGEAVRVEAAVSEAFALTARLGVGRVHPTSSGAHIVFSMPEFRGLLDKWGVQ